MGSSSRNGAELVGRGFEAHPRCHVIGASALWWFATRHGGELVRLAKIRDIATVTLQGEIPQFKRDAPKRRMPSRVERKDVDRRVMAFAMRRVNNDVSRIVPIDATTVQILPEER